MKWAGAVRCKICWHFRRIVLLPAFAGLKFVVLRYLGLTPQALRLRLLRS